MKFWNTLKSVLSASIRPEADPIPAAESTDSLPSTVKHTRTDAEKAQIAEFRIHHADFLEKLEDAVYDANLRMMKAEDPALKAELCQRTIRAYEKLRTVCIATGPGGALYFEDMWEHCSNSANPDFRFIDPVEELLKELAKQL